MYVMQFLALLIDGSLVTDIDGIYNRYYGCFNCLKLFRCKEKEVSEVSFYKTVGCQLGAPHTISCDFKMCCKIYLYFKIGGNINDCVC
jgi:hypothetical protein